MELAALLSNNRLVFKMIRRNTTPQLVSVLTRHDGGWVADLYTVEKGIEGNRWLLKER